VLSVFLCVVLCFFFCSSFSGTLCLFFPS
jgi:hypothetical protein